MAVESVEEIHLSGRYDMRIVRRIRSLVSAGGDAEKKTLMGNFLSLLALQVANYLFPLLTIPYLAHVLGVDRYGSIAFASAVMVYFQTVVDYGFVYSSVREIAVCKDDADAVSSIYSRVVWSRLTLMVCSLVLLILLMACVPKFAENSLILTVSFLLVVGQAIFPDWLFQGLERMKYITFFNVSIKLLFTVCVFVFIRKPDDFWMQPLFVSMGYMGSGVAAMLLVRRWNIRFRRTRFAEIRRSIKSNFDLFVNQIVPNLYGSTSVILLGFFHGDAANGRFGAANQFNSAGSSLLMVLSRTFYPFLARRIDKHGFYERFTLGLGALFSVALFLMAPLLIRWFFPPSFYAAINVLRIIALSMFFLVMIDVYGTNYLLAQGYDKLVRKITMYTSLLGLMVAIPLTYYFSASGVAMAILISRMSTALIEYFCVKRIKCRKI